MRPQHLGGTSEVWCFRNVGPAPGQSNKRFSLVFPVSNTVVSESPVTMHSFGYPQPLISYSQNSPYPVRGWR